MHTFTHLKEHHLPLRNESSRSYRKLCTKRRGVFQVWTCLSVTISSLKGISTESVFNLAMQREWAWEAQEQGTQTFDSAHTVFIKIPLIHYPGMLGDSL